MMHRYRILKNNVMLMALLLLLVLLSACSKKENLLVGKYKPKLNPHPKYFFNVKGYVDPKLIGHINVGWRVGYIGTDKRCDYVENSFEGVNSARYVTVYYHPKPNEAGHYHVSIPIDKYLSGYCHWQAFRIETNYGNGDKSGYGEITDFAPCGTSASCSSPRNKKVDKYKTYGFSTSNCHFKKDNSLTCMWNKQPVLFSDTFLVPKNKNYYFTEHYFYKE